MTDRVEAPRLIAPATRGQAAAELSRLINVVSAGPCVVAGAILGFA
jgi:hypothetical protein